MSQMHQKPVMDVSPWPQGRGFTGAKAWWDYVLSKGEQQRLDNLMGLALMDQKIHDRLVYERDTSLLTAFGLCEETQVWLRQIPADSLVELAQAIVSSVSSVSGMHAASAQHPTVAWEATPEAA
jgi:hypothetical protein